LHPNGFPIASLKADCENRHGNVWYRFVENLIPSLLQEHPDFIGISLGDYSQLLPGLTLALLLNKSTTAHVCIGGNLFGRFELPGEAVHVCLPVRR
jgi:hypothetical protein